MEMCVSFHFESLARAFTTSIFLYMLVRYVLHINLCLQRNEQSEKEKRLESENVKFKSMLQFKELELEQMKEELRRKDAKVRPSSVRTRLGSQQ